MKKETKDVPPKKPTTVESTKRAPSTATTTDSGTKSKNTTDTKFRATNQTKMKPVLISNSPGCGLMAYVRDESPKSSNYPPLQENIYRGGTSKIEKQVESQIVQLLESQCSELGKEIENEKGRNKQLEIEITRLKNFVAGLEKQLRDISGFRQEDKQLKSNLEEDLDNIRELYNTTKRELGKVQQDYNYEMKAREDINSLYQDSLSQREQEKEESDRLLNELRMKIDELEEENEDVRSKMQYRSEFNLKSEEEKLRKVKEMQIKTLNENETKLEKLSAMMIENAELGDKLKESENLRKRFQEKYGKQDEIIRGLMETNKKLEADVQTCKKEVKNVSSLKSHNNKIFDEKMDSLTTENEKYKKEIQQLKKKLAAANSAKSKDTAVNEEEEILEPVKAKAYLFGPVDKMKY
jgi:DNA repair exonuclease SbcCD ATPase subunit